MPSAAHHDLARWAGHHFLKCKPQFFFPNIGNRCVFFYLHKHQKEHDTAHGRTLSVVSHLSSRFPTFLLENLASSPVLRLPFVSSFSVSQSDCFICCLNCQRVRACLGLLHRMQQHPVQWVVWATAQGDVDDAIDCTVLCHQQPSTTEENRAPTKLACISTCISGANVSGNSCKSFWCM